MSLTVETWLAYDFAETTDCLLQIEAAILPDQRVIEPAIGISDVSVVLPLSTPITLTLPPTRTARNDWLNVPPPPTSTTWSTPAPPVNSLARFAQSGAAVT